MQHVINITGSRIHGYMPVCGYRNKTFGVHEYAESLFLLHAEENSSKSFFCILVKFSHMLYIGDSLAEQAWYARMRNGAAKMEHI